MNSRKPLSRRVYIHVLCAICLSAPFAFAQDAVTPAPTSTSVGTGGAELAPVIRSINVVIKDVFDDDSGSLYRTINSLKVNTRESVIRRELLFKVGEVYDQFRIDESARFLRALPFFREVKITTKQEGQLIDITVTVRDQWTLIPQISLAQGGGASNSTSIGILERNLLGYGKRMELLYEDDEGREKVEAVWDDIRLMDTEQRLLAALFDRSDGWRTTGLWGRPFRTLLDRDSWGTSWDFSDTVGRLFEFGDERYIFRQRHQEIAGKYTLAYGDPESKLSRVTLGYDYIRDEFVQAEDDDFEAIDVDPAIVSRDPAGLAEDREFSGPSFAFQRIRQDFISLNYIDRFDIVQDFNLGNSFSFKTQFASEALGSLRNTLLLNFSDSIGIRLGEKHFARMEVGGSTRIDADGFDNTIARGEMRYFNVLGAQYLGGMYMGSHTIASSLSLEYSEDLDRDQQFLLGAENGLRGYASREFSGNKRSILNVEDRIYMFDDILQLFSLGAVVFADVGGATYDQMGRLFSRGLYTDAGIGLRLGFPRSSGGGVVRVDLAFPLREDPEEEGNKFEPRLVVSTGQIFTGRLRAEQYGLERANVTVGLDR